MKNIDSYNIVNTSECDVKKGSAGALIGQVMAECNAVSAAAGKR
jgi:hypothetical protein